VRNAPSRNGVTWPSECTRKRWARLRRLRVETIDATMAARAANENIPDHPHRPRARGFGCGCARRGRPTGTRRGGGGAGLIASIGSIGGGGGVGATGSIGSIPPGSNEKSLMLSTPGFPGRTRTPLQDSRPMIPLRCGECNQSMRSKLADKARGLRRWI
jgi:hypothetical protein